MRGVVSNDEQGKVDEMLIITQNRYFLCDV